jgi:transporter family protein
MDIGLIYIVLAQLFWSTELILVRKFFPTTDSLFLSAVGSIIGTIFYIPFFMASKTKLFSMPPKEIIILVIYSLTSWFLAQIFFISGIQRGLNAFTITLATLTFPVFSVILAMIFLKETLTIKAVIGGILIIVGFLIISIK